MTEKDRKYYKIHFVIEADEYISAKSEREAEEIFDDELKSMYLLMIPDEKKTCEVASITEVKESAD